ncbi:sugar transporter SWEET1 [Leptidea sinapis]|uniref:sugar transporter SWEET1 n=1 Tax=Leptidea sinapis TaxID=189913 RepID=UPI00213BF624|nr:sugar transporter SWEET1 [Leptidea sinapis]XP_050671376.1 sugar transporter SWEET1 [Leptidea sinapis]
METLADLLQPYKSAVGTTAAVVTVGQMFSGTFLCWDIYKQNSTKGIGIMPFVGGLIMSLLNLKFGFVLRDDTMIQVNFFGLALNIVYLMVYFNYSSQKGRVWTQIGAGGAFSAAVLGYAEYEDPSLVENRLGTIITVFMFYLIASPLFGLRDIIKKQSTEGMPFPMILSGAVVSFMWLLYGIILRNNFLVLQNVVAFVLCAAQLALFVVYPGKRAPRSQPKSKSKQRKLD